LTRVNAKGGKAVKKVQSGGKVRRGGSREFWSKGGTGRDITSLGAKGAKKKQKERDSRVRKAREKKKKKWNTPKRQFWKFGEGREGVWHRH